MSVRIAPDVYVSRPGPGEVVLLNARTGEYFSLDSVGAFVWTRLEAGPSTLDALAVEVAEVFEVDFEQCRADLDRLAVSLASAGLVSED